MGLILVNIQPAGFTRYDLAVMPRFFDGALWIFQPWEEDAVRAAVQAWPGAVHIARPYPRPWPGFNPAGFAACIVGNEPNAPGEPDAGTDLAAYVADHRAICAQLRPRGVALISPAVSPAVPDWPATLVALAPLIEDCDYIGVHRYGDVDTLPAVAGAGLPARPLIVTEQGAVAPGDPLRWTGDDAPPVCLFAWRWADHESAGYDLAERADVLARLVQRPRRAAPALPSPHPDTAPAPVAPPPEPPATPAPIEETPPPEPPAPPAATAPKERPMGPTAYTTQIDPQGSGENRCGPGAAAAALAVLIPGDYDQYQLMRQWTAAINAYKAGQGAGDGAVFSGGTNPADIIAVAPQYHLTGAPWVHWSEAVAAWQDGGAVLALLQNSYLRPRNYPDGPGWTEHADGSPVEHWVLLLPLTYADRTDREYLLLMDPLCYDVARGKVYQGPSVQTVDSVIAGIQATPYASSGVVLRRQ